MTSRAASKRDLPIEESVITIGPPEAELIGVLARPADAAKSGPIGVVIVVGGPQTRVGSHRQFVLMARALARAGHACLRFDYTGMGDSAGPKPDFEKAGPDIGRACDALLAVVPACERIALWGLCDGATAALFYAQNDPRIAAVIAANPWARSEATRAAAIVTEHYGSRLRSPEFWKKLVSGKVNVVGAGREAIGHLLKARASGGAVDSAADPSLPVRLARALAAQREKVRLQISGKDMTAAEFEIAMRAHGALDGGHASTLRLESADHTFSEAGAWRKVIDDTVESLIRLQAEIAAPRHGTDEGLHPTSPSTASATSSSSRILYLHRTQAQGVEGVHIWEMVRAFRGLGHSVRVLAPGGEAVDPSEPSTGPPGKGKPKGGRLGPIISRHVPELVFEILEIGYNFLALFRGAALLNTWRCDAVYERYAIFSFAGLLLSRRKGMKWILEVNYTARSPLVRHRSMLLKPLAIAIDRQLFRRADGLAAVSSTLRDELISQYGVRPEKIIIVPNAADPDRFHPGIPAVQRIAGREVVGRDVIGFVGGFYPWHGLDILVNAFARLAEEFPCSILALVGDGPERNRIEAMVSALGFEDRVLFAGRVPHGELASLVASFAVGVMPDSNDYGSPMKIFEYMAMGKPVVVPDYPPLLDVVVDGREGYVFQRRDSPALADALRMVLADEVRRMAMGRAARDAVESRHNWRSNSLSVLAFLEASAGE